MSAKRCQTFSTLTVENWVGMGCHLAPRVFRPYTILGGYQMIARVSLYDTHYILLDLYKRSTKKRKKLVNFMTNRNGKRYYSRDNVWDIL